MMRNGWSPKLQMTMKIALGEVKTSGREGREEGERERNGGIQDDPSGG